MILKVSDDPSIIRAYADHVGRSFRDLPRNGKTRRTKKKKAVYVDAIGAFDIETTNIKELKQSFMYIWQWDTYIDDVHHVILGRTWEQFKFLLYHLKTFIGDRLFRAYVHNLSFEFQWFTGLFTITPSDVFCLNKRRIAKVKLLDVFDFRCSYVLTNLKLSSFCKEMQTKSRKLDGEKFDYTKIRTPSQSLRRYEINYCIMDVKSVTEAVTELNKRYGDDHYSQPMTATGYIRRRVKKALQDVSYRYRLSIQPRLPEFTLMEEAFRGGDTHCNRYSAGTIVDNVFSVDRSSSYPEVMVNRKFPKNGFSYLGELTIKQIIKKIKVNNMALLMRVSFHNLELIDRYEAMPYIPVAKRLFGGTTDCFEDNGRVLSCSGWFTMSICDIDLRIILNQYRFDDFICIEAYGTIYDYLPKPFRDLIIDLYKKKTSYKGVDPVIYSQSKSEINSVYGMCCMSPIQDSIKFIQNQDPDKDPYQEEKVPDEERAEVLEKYGKKGFIPYQIALYTTAYARLELFQGARIIKDSGATLHYNDTDSLKYSLWEEDAKMPDFTAYNENKIRLSTESGMYATDPKGIVHYAGVYEDEGCSRFFRSWGAKKYCTEDESGHCKLTLAGVPKAKGSRELERKGGIRAFKVGTWDNPKGFLFEDAGLAVIYNDHEDRDIMVNGEKIHLINNVYLYQDHYELAITDKYEEAIDTAKSLLMQDGYHVIL